MNFRYEIVQINTYLYFYAYMCIYIYRKFDRCQNVLIIPEYDLKATCFNQKKRIKNV